MSDTQTHFDEYADAAGLRPSDMPNSHHPLLENDDDIKSLSDLVQVRARHSIEEQQESALSSLEDEEIDVSDALTFPHRRRTTADEPDVSDFDADARSQSPADDADDMSYMTRQDVVESMNETDPAPEAGADDGEYPGGVRELDRAAPLEGTVAGVIRGTSTHLPIDLGAGGFQIEDPDRDQEGNVLPGAIPTDLTSDDGGRMPTAAVNVNEADDALDATRRMR
jgi:hypothetical protein